MGPNAWLIVAAIATVVGLATYLSKFRDRWPQAVFVGLAAGLLLLALAWAVQSVTSFEWVSAES